MDPVILKRTIAYDGQSADLFSAAVILFILTTGCWPFKEATSADPYYSLIEKNQADTFWEIFKETGSHSQAFKDMLTCMLQPKPS